MRPYEFGYSVGARIEKQAVQSAPEPQHFGHIAGQVALGSGSMLDQVDPMQRGIIQDLALYSNPFTGVPTAVNDVSRHLYNGRFMDAGMSGLSGALSFLPGFGFAARGAGRLAVQGGKALARAGAPQIGNAVAKGSAKFVNQGRNLMAGANQAASQTIQRIPGVSLAQKPGMVGKFRNAAINNPMQTAQYVPLGTAVGGLGMAAAGVGAGAGGQQQQPQQQQQFQPSGLAGGQAGRRLVNF